MARACARVTSRTILRLPTAWPLFKRSSVAAFERSVTVQVLFVEQEKLLPVPGGRVLVQEIRTHSHPKQWLGRCPDRTLAVLRRGRP
jgi:hypothetical protein